MKSIVTTVAALVMTSGVALADHCCPEKDKAEAKVVQVSDEKSGDCAAATACADAKVTQVADKKASDCSSPCSEKTDAQIEPVQHHIDQDGKPHQSGENHRKMRIERGDIHRRYSAATGSASSPPGMAVPPAGPGSGRLVPSRAAFTASPTMTSP